MQKDACRHAKDQRSAEALLHQLELSWPVQLAGLLKLNRCDVVNALFAEGPRLSAHINKIHPKLPEVTYSKKAGGFVRPQLDPAVVNRWSSGSVIARTFQHHNTQCELAMLFKQGGHKLLYGRAAAHALTHVLARLQREG
eukprot:6207154-Pleurochrysis_carterae.AAC.1